MILAFEAFIFLTYLVWGQDESDNKDEGEPAHEDCFHYSKEVALIGIHSVNSVWRFCVLIN